ncbi:hypothetical protein BDW69DRAFT_170751 [Aspergillus filifer]
MRWLDGNLGSFRRAYFHFPFLFGYLLLRGDRQVEGVGWVWLIWCWVQDAQEVHVSSFEEQMSGCGVSSWIGFDGLVSGLGVHFSGFQLSSSEEPYGAV